MDLKLIQKPMKVREHLINLPSGLQETLQCFKIRLKLKLNTIETRISYKNLD